MDGDPRYAGTTVEVHDEVRGIHGLMTYEQFVDANCKQFGRYDMLHTYAAVPAIATLFMEGLLEDGPHYDADWLFGHFRAVPIVDVLWARARLEGLPNGGDRVLADPGGS